MKLTVEECKYFIFLLFQMANEGTTPFFVVVDGVFVALFSLVRLFVYTTHSSWSVFCLCQMPESNCWSSEWKILEYEIYCCVNICIVWCGVEQTRNVKQPEYYITDSLDAVSEFRHSFPMHISRNYWIFPFQCANNNNKKQIQFTIYYTTHQSCLLAHGNEGSTCSLETHKNRFLHPFH